MTPLIHPLSVANFVPATRPELVLDAVVLLGLALLIAMLIGELVTRWRKR